MSLKDTRRITSRRIIIPTMSTADRIDVASILKGKVPIGSRVTVRGWVRTRRDSKAGLSFIHLHDGSCFDPLQVVAPADAAQLRERDQEADHGLLGHRDRHAAASQGRGRPSRSRRDRVEVVGWVDDPDTYPIQPKKTRSSTCARSRTCGRARTRSARSRACGTASAWRSTATSTSTASSGSTRRSSRRATPRAPARCSASPRSTSPTATRSAHARRPHRLHAGLLRQGGVPDRQRPAERRDLLPARCRRSTRSGRRSAPRTPTRAGTSPSSG